MTVRPIQSCLYRALLVAGAIVVIGTVTPSLSQATEDLSVTFSKGELLQLVSATYVKGKDKELREYFQKTFPLAAGYGYTPLIQFHVTEVLEGTYQPEGFIGLYKWPSQAAAERFGHDPQWAPIKATRPEVFQELRVSTFALEEELKMTFKDGHVYELQVLWLSNDHRDDYNRYKQAMQVTLDQVGGRVIARLSGGQYESVQPWPHQPDQIVILEWPNANARAAYLNSKAFQQQQHLLYSGVANAQSFLTKATPYGPLPVARPDHERG